MIKRSLALFMAVLLCFGLLRLSMGKDSHINVLAALNELSKLEYDLSYLILLVDESGQSTTLSFADVMFGKLTGISISDIVENEGNIFLDFFYAALNYLLLAIEKLNLAVQSVGAVITDSYENLRIIFRSIAILLS